MFMPLESALAAALDVKPALHADAMRQHVLIATPTLLVALLRAVAYGWQQDAVADNARTIAKTGSELYERVATFAAHFEEVGRRLGQSTEAYNRAVGSFTARMLPSARRLRELDATTEDPIEPPPPIEIEVREGVGEGSTSSPTPTLDRPDGAP
jgi:DNA recombination protein RmuC